MRRVRRRRKQREQQIGVALVRLREQSAARQCARLRCPAQSEVAVSRHFPSRRVPAYWGAQIAGATVAAVTLRSSLGDVADVGATLPSGSDRQAFLWEVVLTFFLMLVIMAVATDTRAVGEAAALAIGGTVGLCALVGGPVSGASMNPARSLGPALVSGDVSSLWVYLLAPLVGASLGALAYQLLRGEQPISSSP